MEAIVLRELGRAPGVEEVAVPEAGPGEVRIRVEACGVCHSDLHVADGDWESLRRHTKLPLVLGHEAAGVVDSVGAGVTGFRTGDRVGIPWLQWTCGECEYCAAGREALCPKQRITGVMADGGYAEYMTAPASHVVRIPAELTAFEAAPLLCAGLTVYRALKVSEAKAGESVAVYGAGGLGHLAMQMAASRGMEVIAVDVAPEKLKLARECGAHAVVNTRAGEKVPRVQTAVVCSASAAAYQTALGGLRRGGTLVVVGMPAEPIAFHAVKLVAGEIRILASAVGSRAELREVLALAAERGIRCHSRARRRVEAPQVLEEMRRGEIVGRAVLV